MATHKDPNWKYHTEIEPITVRKEEHKMIFFFSKHFSIKEFNIILSVCDWNLTQNTQTSGNCSPFNNQKVSLFPRILQIIFYFTHLGLFSGQPQKSHVGSHTFSTPITI